MSSYPDGWRFGAHAGDVAHAHATPAIDLVVTKALEAAADELLRVRAREVLQSIQRGRSFVLTTIHGAVVAVDTYTDRDADPFRGPNRGRARLRDDAGAERVVDITVAAAYRLLDAMSYRAVAPRVRITVEVLE